MAHVPVRRKRAAALLLATLTGAGCATVHDLSAPTPVPPGPARKATLTAPPPPQAAATPGVPPELLQPGATLTLAQVVDIALAHSPLTRASYRQARSEAANVGSKRGAYLPTIDASATAGRGKQPSLGVQSGITATTYGPAASLYLLLFDFGGRSADVEEARQGLLAADWHHNSVIHDVALGVQEAYFQYLNLKAQLEAARASLEQARVGSEAADARHDAGVATIADVLQARTALAQARLDVDGLEGQVLAMRGALATAMGLPATVPLDVGSLPGEVPIDRAHPAIEAVIADARLNRPDLAAIRALAGKAAAHVDAVRAGGLPSVALQAGAGRTYYNAASLDTHLDAWSAHLALSVPLFHGFSQTFDLRRAREDAAVAQAEAEGYEQQVVLQVWTSYYGLETATQRVRASRALLDSATESERVALGRYKEGVGTVIDLLTAQSALASARAQEIQARADWFVAVARLAHDSGTLMPSEDIAIVTEEKK